MKKLTFMTVAAIVALSSCTNDSITENESSNTNGNPKVFTATIDNGTTSRATLNNSYTVEWESTDQVNINGAVYSVTPTNGNAATAQLTKISGDEPSGIYKAIYPASYASGTGTNVTYALPSVETYTEGKFSNIPMYAEVTSTNLSFKNICGVLAISNITVTDLKAIRVISSSTTDKLSGAFTMSGSTITMASSCTSNQVTLTCGATGIDANGKTFYIPLPPATYGKLQIVVESGSRTVNTKTTSVTSVTIERGKIYNISCSSYDSGTPNIFNIYATTKSNLSVKCTAVCSGGALFAQFNLGASNDSQCGGTYQWGSILHDGSFSSYCSSTNDIQGTEYDTAKNIWGVNWQMPTMNQYNELPDNCVKQWKTNNGLNGMSYTGQDGFAQNNVFIPATDGTTAYYYSSSPSGVSNVLSMKFTSNDYPSYYAGGRDKRESIRPILR